MSSSESLDAGENRLLVVLSTRTCSAARESAGKKRKGKCPADCNTYLKWAFIEAGNVVSLHHKKWPHRHVAQLYERVQQSSKMHGKATVAVARHLAEASYWVLTKQQLYREPQGNRPAFSSTHW